MFDLGNFLPEQAGGATDLCRLKRRRTSAWQRNPVKVTKGIETTSGSEIPEFEISVAVKVLEETIAFSNAAV